MLKIINKPSINTAFILMLLVCSVSLMLIPASYISNNVIININMIILVFVVILYAVVSLVYLVKSSKYTDEARFIKIMSNSNLVVLFTFISCCSWSGCFILSRMLL